MNLKIVLKVDGTGVTSRPGRETQETVWVDDEQIYVESKHDDDVDDEQIDLDKGSPPKNYRFCLVLYQTCEPNHPSPEKESFGTEKVIFTINLQEFVCKMGSNMP